MAKNFGPPNAPRETRTAAAAIMPGKTVKVDGGRWALAGDGDQVPLIIMEPDYQFGKRHTDAVTANSRAAAVRIGIGQVGYAFVLNGAASAGELLTHAADGDLNAENGFVCAELAEDHDGGAEAVLRRVIGAAGIKS